MIKFSYRNVVVSSLAVLLGAVAMSAAAIAEDDYVDDFENRYPGSMTTMSGGEACFVCHDLADGGDSFNAYGWDLRQLMNAGANINSALAQAEMLDSDMDPTGSDNITEINASAQPGWTPGPNNTFFFDDGSTSTGETPPPAISGDLDPAPGLGTNYCMSSANSSGQASLISAGGSASVAANDLVLSAGPGPVGEPGIFYYGPTQLAGPPFGNGFRCVGGPAGTVVRIFPFAQGDAAGIMMQPLDNTAAAHAQVTAGASLNFQAWFRDPAGGGAGFDLSDGLNIVFTP